MALKHILVLCALLACRSKPAQIVAGDVAVVDVTVIPMDRDARLAHHTVVVKGDRIVAVGPTSSIKPAAGVKTIDGRGKFLIPGLADMHTHTFDARQLALFVTEGVTTIRVMWGFPATLGARNAAGSRLSPTIATAGSIIDGDPPVWPGSTGVTTAQEATTAVEEQKRAGYDFIKVYAKLPKEAYAAIVATAAKLGMRVIGHVPAAVGLGGVLDAKQASIEHLDGYSMYAKGTGAPVEEGFKARLRLWKSADPAKLAEAVARTKAAGTWNCPTLVVMQRLSNFDRPQTFERPENKFVSAATKSGWDPTKDFRFASWTAEDYEAARGSGAWYKKLVKQLSDAGVGLLAGTDVGNPWLVPGFSLHEELTLLVESGLTPYQALGAATAAPAQFLNAQAGVVAKDRRADLVLLDADPLADIHNTSKIAGVMLRGRWLLASELAAEQERIAALYRGDRSQFDTTLDTTGAVFTARYDFGGAGMAGEERIAAWNNGRLVGDVSNEGFGIQHVEVELGKDSHGQKIHFTDDGLDLTLARDNGKAHVTGKLGADTIDFSESIAADEFLGGEPTIADAIFMHSLSDLAVGKERDVKLVVLLMMPKPHLERMTLNVRRVEDRTREIGKQSIRVRRFSVTMSFRSSTLETDEAGWPVQTQSATRVE